MSVWERPVLLWLFYPSVIFITDNSATLPMSHLQCVCVCAWHRIIYPLRQHVQMKMKLLHLVALLSALARRQKMIVVHLRPISESSLTISLSASANDTTAVDSIPVGRTLSTITIAPLRFRRRLHGIEKPTMDASDNFRVDRFSRKFPHSVVKRLGFCGNSNYLRCFVMLRSPSLHY